MSIRATGRGSDLLPKALTDLTREINDLINSSDLYSELCRGISTTILAHGIEKGQVDPLNLTGNAAQMGFMSGALVGFQLGLREAGLSMGIGVGAKGDVK